MNYNWDILFKDWEVKKEKPHRGFDYLVKGDQSICAVDYYMPDLSINCEYEWLTDDDMDTETAVSLWLYIKRRCNPDWEEEDNALLVSKLKELGVIE